MSVRAVSEDVVSAVSADLRLVSEREEQVPDLDWLPLALV